MKIWTSKYRNHWVSPYHILKFVCFWERDDGVFYDHDDSYKPVYGKLVKALDPVCTAWQKFLDFVHPRWTYVKIDFWDTWSMDHTLADVILPMLKQLKATKHGSPMVDEEDVPVHLQSEAYKKAKKRKPKTSTTRPDVHAVDMDDDNTLHERWDWVLSEMIWAFEQKVDDNSEDKFWDHANTNGSAPWDEDYEPPKCNWEGLRAHQARKTNGYRLFGKYYEALWD